MLRAMRAEKSVGRPSASSNALVCRLWVPPSTAAMRLDGGADHVVVGVLLGERHARGLAVRAQHQRLRVLRLELRHHPVPQQAGGPELGDLHEEVHADGEEEREPPGERVDVEAAVEGGAHVLEAVGDRERQLLVGRRPGLLHVVAGDRDRVELRHVVAPCTR